MGPSRRQVARSAARPTPYAAAKVNMLYPVRSFIQLVAIRLQEGRRKRRRRRRRRIAACAIVIRRSCLRLCYIIAWLNPSGFFFLFLALSKGAVDLRHCALIILKTRDETTLQWLNLSSAYLGGKDEQLH
jgi:hypothetical protein